jgi:glycosyltransferase involved in cell wall biosynthesis
MSEPLAAPSQVNATRPVRRLLFLLPFAPRLDAVHGGSRTIAQLLAALADRHRLAVVYLRGAEEPGMADALRARCEIVEEVPRGPEGRVRRSLRGARAVRSLLGGTPPWVSEWAVPCYGRRVREIAEDWQPDIVQIEYHVMGQYLSALRGNAAPRVLVQHDPGATAARGRLTTRRWLARLPAHLEVRAWERYEAAIMQEVQAVVVFTERDRRAIERQVEGVRVARIPIGTTLPERPLSPLGQEPASLLFLGSFVHPPNTDAAVRLITSIFPRLRERFPDLWLHVVGDAPPQVVRDAAGVHVAVTGRVPDVEPYLDRAAVVVAPLRLGGGMRVKVLEALAAGKATVASPLAAEGLDVVDGEHIVLADSDDQFCDAVAGLLQDPDRRLALAARARTWAGEHLGWDRAVRAYESLYDTLSATP